MDQILEKILLLVAGGVIAALSAWFADFRSERRRKTVKLEEAYLAWLNSQSTVLRGLRELTELAEGRPKSAEEHALILEKFDRLYSELQSLRASANQAFMYERVDEKKTLLDLQSKAYEALSEALRLTVRHQKLHLEWIPLIESAREIASQCQEMLKLPAVDADPVLKAKIEEKMDKAQSYINRTNEHLAKCNDSLIEDLKGISTDVKKDIEKSSVLRRALVKS
jgi:phytoene dehydrogenase-like protein